MVTDSTSDRTSAQVTDSQMPSTPKRAGRMKTAEVSNTKARAVEIMAETTPLFLISAVEKSPYKIRKSRENDLNNANMG